MKTNKGLHKIKSYFNTCIKHSYILSLQSIVNKVFPYRNFGFDPYLFMNNFSNL